MDQTCYDPGMGEVYPDPVQKEMSQDCDIIDPHWTGALQRR